MLEELAKIFPPERLHSRLIDRVAYAGDAGFYRLIPRAVEQPKTLDEIRLLFAFCRKYAIPLTFRAAGTSLSGQSVSDGILADIQRHWKKISVEGGGKYLRAECGVIGGMANRYLAQYNAKIGPDPASINACAIGGILANNASGMCCGVAQNSYHTLESLQFLLPNGCFVDTADPQADEKFRRQSPEIADGLLALREEVLRNPLLSQKIREKYRIKNTVGYSLNALLDFDTPSAIMSHLLIGSEGTLGFIAEAVFRTVPDYPLKLTGLLFYPTIFSACEAIEPLRNVGASALELLDRASLKSVENHRGAPSIIRGLPPNSAALLVEFHAVTEIDIKRFEKNAREICVAFPLLAPAEFTREPLKQAQFWKIRKGLLPSVGSIRKQGTSVIIEDVAFPLEHLAQATLDLQSLFGKHGYEEGIIFGHARDGNLHFVITQSFHDSSEIARYEGFMADLVELVVKKYNGSLKAEHGTGRNIAPFVETEWGGEAYEIMKKLKRLIDPDGIMNPGVILNENPVAHLTDLKTLPPVDSEVDRCIECGFCEQKCPSRNLTLTPRTRIAVRREIERLRQEISGEKRPEKSLIRAISSLEQDFLYDGIETCAVDGLCASACPVGINTGDLIKRFRTVRNSPRAKKIALRVAKHFAMVESVVRGSVFAGNFAVKNIGIKPMQTFIFGAEKFLKHHLPKWNRGILPAPHRLPETVESRAEFLYFPACVGRVMNVGERGSAEILMTLANRAGVRIWIPPVEGLCCGTPFFSKGFPAAGQFMLEKTIENLWQWSERGRLPIIIDSSSCAWTLQSCADQLPPALAERYRELNIIDAVEFAHDTLLKKLRITKRLQNVALHPVCAGEKSGIIGKMTVLARACADDVFIPKNAGCCGFAGDRGLLFPELTISATRAQAEEIKSRELDGCYSSNLTCELAMTSATRKKYDSILALLELATR